MKAIISMLDLRSKQLKRIERDIALGSLDELRDLLLYKGNSQRCVESIASRHGVCLRRDELERFVELFNSKLQWN